jgi:hypothetical protein
MLSGQPLNGGKANMLALLWRMNLPPRFQVHCSRVLFTAFMYRKSSLGLCLLAAGLTGCATGRAPTVYQVQTVPASPTVVYEQAPGRVPPPAPAPPVVVQPAPVPVQAPPPQQVQPPAQQQVIVQQPPPQVVVQQPQPQPQIIVQQTQPQVVEMAPPAARVEVIPPSPYPGHVWVHGYWRWGGHGWVWMPGVWIAPPRPHLVWIPGRWEREHHGWRWRPGHWR